MFLLVIVGILLVASVDSRSSGGTGLSSEPALQEKTYPSQVRRYYYSYYINYFTPSGIQYAASNQDSDRTVSVCKNTEPYFDNGTYLGVFPCPMEKDPDDFSYCCGEDNYEYCCRRKDTVQFKVMVGCSVAAVLGAIITVIICIVLCVGKKKTKIQKRQSGKIRMSELGIPFYSLKTSKLLAKQSEDGYHIFVEFKSKKYFNNFWEHLHSKYAHITWKFTEIREGVEVKEGKITTADGGWVSVVLNDDVDGKPVMVVSRETAAVIWMNGPFQDIIQDMPEDSGWCCATHHRTHPHRSTTDPDTATEEVKGDANEGAREEPVEGAGEETSTPDSDREDTEYSECRSSPPPSPVRMMADGHENRAEREDKKED